MLIRVKDQDFHVEEQLGRILVLAGIAEELILPKAKVQIGPPRSRWAVVEEISGLAIRWNCDCCKQGASYWGKTPEREKFFHCGVAEVIPSAVITEYLAALRRKPEIVDADAAVQRRRLHPLGDRQSSGAVDYAPADPAGL